MSAFALVGTISVFCSQGFVEFGTREKEGCIPALSRSSSGLALLLERPSPFVDLDYPGVSIHCIHK